ncbi:acyl-CoA N-acyltransferase [Phlyctochytrium arcticum]|nr:acyl-CoA N-acyltransferase [Phlyctochytrium arcticum]
MSAEDPPYKSTACDYYKGSCTSVPPVELECQRIRLTPLKEDDLQELYDLSHNHNLPDVDIFKYFPWDPFPGFDAFKEYFLNGPKLLAAETSMPWVIWKLPGKDDPEGSTPKRIGCIAYIHMVPQFRNAEIGAIWITPTLQRGGYSTEATYLLLRHALDDLAMTRVEWRCHHMNEASRAIAKSMGFMQDGFLRRHMVREGDVRHTVVMSITDEDWKKGGKEALYKRVWERINRA